VLVAVAVMSVGLAVIVVDGAATVMVLAVTPMQEQALEYPMAPLQAEAYAGMAVGASTTSRFFKAVVGKPTVRVTIVSTVVVVVW
jgi:hypothetical protein